VRFVAGNCSQFDITPSADVDEIAAFIFNVGCGTQIKGECIPNVISGIPFTFSGNSAAGANLLTPGTPYILLLRGDVGANTFNICYNANGTFALSNTCAGALTAVPSPTTFNNRGDCNFSGTVDDITANDPAASTFCALSSENTQWITFLPSANVSSFQLIGTGINCTGGGCGFQLGIFSGSCGALVSEGCYANSPKSCAGANANTGPTNAAGSPYDVAWSNTGVRRFTATISIKTGLFNGTERFYFIMDGNADSDCQYTLSGVNLQVLPVTLKQIDGRYRKEYSDVRILWTTSTETNNEKFILEKSYDAIEWFNLSDIYSNGDSDIVTNYEYHDKKIKSGTVYYRLWQVDHDGTRENLKTIAVSIPFTHKSLLMKRVNILGVEIKDHEKYSGVLIEVYEDGTSKRVLSNNGIE
jgi:hypothetical protein